MGYSSVLRYFSVAIEVALISLNLLFYTHADLLKQFEKSEIYLETKISLSSFPLNTFLDNGK